MADQSPSTLSILLDTLSAIFSFFASINWSLRISQLFYIFALPFRLTLYPLRIVTGILLTVFAPLIYLFSSFISIFRACVAFLASLEPLYTFFGAAAGVGIITGIMLAIFSSIATSRLGMQDDEYSSKSRSKERLLRDTQNLRDSSSTDIDFQWLESPSSRRKPTGLLSQTIHEEEDDSEF